MNKIRQFVYICLFLSRGSTLIAGSGVSYRENVDGPNYHNLMTAFPFNVDGRILEWYFYANSMGQARLQVI